MRARKMQNANARSTRRSFWHLYTGTFAFLIAQKHRCAASRIVSVRRCRRRRTALASCACASKQCSFSTADRLLWLDQSQRRRRCLQRCACEISASPDSECAVSESRKALHCATILHAHELTSCASSSAGTKPCRQREVSVLRKYPAGIDDATNLR